MEMEDGFPIEDGWSNDLLVVLQAPMIYIRRWLRQSLRRNCQASELSRPLSSHYQVDRLGVDSRLNAELGHQKPVAKNATAVFGVYGLRPSQQRVDMLVADPKNQIIY